MSQENVQRARAVFDTLGTRDAERVVALSDRAVAWHSFFAISEGGGVYRGHDGTRRYMKDLSDAFDIARAEVDDTLEVADLVVLVGRIRFRGKGSGVESVSPAGWVLKFRDGKLLWFHAFREPARALESLGLAE